MYSSTTSRSAVGLAFLIPIVSTTCACQSILAGCCRRPLSAAPARFQRLSVWVTCGCGRLRKRIRLELGEGASAVPHIYRILSSSAWRPPSVLVLTLSPFCSLSRIDHHPDRPELVSDHYVINLIHSLPKPDLSVLI